MTEIQVAYYMVAATGVLIAAAFYVINLRTQNRNREAQLLNMLQRDIADYQGWQRNVELNYMDWTSYEDFENKYGSDNNPESYAKRLTAWFWNNNLGVMIRQKLVDETMVYDTFGSVIIWSWAMWEPIILEQRRRYMGPNWMEHFEYAANRMRTIQISRGIQWEPPETGLRYRPDK